MITIVDSGGANISSIVFCLERLRIQSQLSHDPETIQKSSHIILPGVGAAAAAMKRLKAYRLDEVIRSLTQPILGICLGMQLLFDSSTEGNTDCLGLIPGSIKKLPKNTSLSIPHMGWNKLKIMQSNALLTDIADQAYVYFVHSYFAPITEYTTATAYYGEEFSACVQYKNFYGTQFHPERSSNIGMKILKNFTEL